MEYTIKRRVSVPTFSMREPGEYFIMPVTPIVARPSREDGAKPVYVMRVCDLTTGEERELVLGQILRETLLDRYPDDTYVNKQYRVVKLPSGKRSGTGQNEYNLYYVDEIDFKG